MVKIYMEKKLKNDIVLMCANTEVASINVEEYITTISSKKLLPFVMQNKFDAMDISVEENFKSAFVKFNKCYTTFVNWAISRVLLLSRANAKWLYNAAAIEQTDTPETKLKIAMMCRCVSVLDNYWIKVRRDDVNWDEMNIRENSLNSVVTQIALKGSSFSLQGSLVNPEYTTNGAYAKGWVRDDGGLWLYKKGYDKDTESRIEIMVSNLLDKLNVNHLHYEAGSYMGDFVCKCPCMTNNELSILSGLDFITYCNSNGLNPDLEMLQIDADSIYKMIIVDYLIANRDRHHQNWGFYYNPDTMKILGCHPLFDHNNAFDIEYMVNEEAPYLFRNNLPMKDCALNAVKHTSIHFTGDIAREDFITERQYTCFMERARQLKLV